MNDTTHQERDPDQFTRQATPFSTANTSHRRQCAADDRRIGASPRPSDTLLDVACGGGLVVCAFASHVKHATGIDMTPAMLDRARHLATEKGIENVTWDRGDVGRLPYADGTFDIVVTRFSMHHFLDPLDVLREMVRVCAPGGRVVVIDMYASDDPAKAAEWNRAEKLRDPSHVRCLTLPELKGLFGSVGLPAPRATFYELRDEIRNLLARSFPNPGDDLKIIAMFAASAGGRSARHSACDARESGSIMLIRSPSRLRAGTAGYPRYARLDPFIVQQRPPRPVEHDAAALQYVAAIGDPQRHRGILLHQQYRYALRVDAPYRLEYLFDQHRCQPHARLVHEKYARPRHQGTCGRQHLLFAS